MESKETHYKLTDLDFETQFSNCQLDPTVFSHEAHLRLAWIHLEKYGLDKAKENIRQQLKIFVHHVGAQEKYHATLTLAAVHAVFHFKQKSSTDNFMDFIEEFPLLKANFKELLNSHYSFDIFKSSSAKNDYIAPDLIPFE